MKSSVQLSPKPDVAKCAGFRCGERVNCYRFVRPAANHRQAYAEFWRESGSCDGYLPIKMAATVIEND